MTGQAKGPTSTVDPLTLSGGTPGGALEKTLADAVKPRGLFMTEDHRYYWNGDGPYPSVTTILKVLDKPAVTQWVARETAKASFRLMQSDGVPRTQDEFVSAALAQPKEVTDVAAKLGSSVHVLADLEARGTGATAGLVPDEARPYLEAFRGFLAFLEAQGGTIVSSEKAVLNLSEGYAGTYDLLVSLPRGGDPGYRGKPTDLWLLDVKTSRGYYPEFALQIAAYGMAEFIGLEGDPTPYPMPHVDRYGVLHLRPDAYPGEASQGWRLVEYPITDEDRLAFLAALNIYIWKGKGRFTKSILQKAIYQGTVTGIGTDPLTRNDGE